MKKLRAIVLCALVCAMVCLPALAWDAKKATETAAELKRLREQALASFEAGELDAALEAATQAILLRPDQPLYRYIRAEICMEQGNSAAAFVDASYALSLEKDADTYDLRAMALRKLGRYELAMLDHASALESGADVYRLNNRAMTLMRMGRYEEALADIDLALAEDAEQPLLFANRGAALYGLGRLAEAEEEFARCVALGGEAPTERELLRLAAPAGTPAPTAAALDPAARSQALLEEAVDAIPGETGKAIELLNQAVELDPRNAEAFAQRGVACAQQERYGEALEDLAYALSIEATPMRLTNFASMLMLLGRYEESLAEMNRVVEMNPDNAFVYINRGNAYYNLDRNEEALADYNAALALQSGEAKAWVYRADTYMRMERYQEALADYRQACQLAPDNQRARDGVKKSEAELAARGIEAVPFGPVPGAGAMQGERRGEKARAAFTGMLRKAGIAYAAEPRSITEDDADGRTVMYELSPGMIWFDFLTKDGQDAGEYILALYSFDALFQQAETIFPLYLRVMFGVDEEKAAALYARLLEEQEPYDGGSEATLRAGDGKATLNRIDEDTLYITARPVNYR